MTIEGYAYYDVTFSASYLHDEVENFLKNGLTKCAVVLPPTEQFVNTRVQNLIPTEA